MKVFSYLLIIFLPCACGQNAQSSKLPSHQRINDAAPAVVVDGGAVKDARPCGTVAAVFDAAMPESRVASLTSTATSVDEGGVRVFWGAKDEKCSPRLRLVSKTSQKQLSANLGKLANTADVVYLSNRQVSVSRDWKHEENVHRVLYDYTGLLFLVKELSLEEVCLLQRGNSFELILRRYIVGSKMPPIEDLVKEINKQYEANHRKELEMGVAKDCLR